MKALAKPFLAEGEFVSTNDVLLALLWMLTSEMTADKPVTNGSDLNVADTTASVTIEFLKIGINVVPENYCGNAVLANFLATAGVDFEGKSLPHVLALVAGIVRKALSNAKEQPLVQAQGILAYYAVVSSGVFPQPADNFRVSLTNLVKTPVQEIDFGKGKPVLAHFTPPMPLIGTLMAAGPGPYNDESILIYCQFLGRQLEMLKNSVVIKECAPKMKRLYQSFNVDEMKAFLGMK